MNSSADVTGLVKTCAVTLDQVKAYVDEFVYNLDVNKLRSENFSIVANDLGVELETTDIDEFNKRNILLAIDSYKSKGTLDSIRILFYTLGFDVEVVPLWTPDYIEDVILPPPYLYFTLPKYFPLTSVPSPFPVGTVDVSVSNPDGQYDLYPKSFTFTS